MKKSVLMVSVILLAMGVFSSCTKDDANNPDYLSATISGTNWSANNIYGGTDTTGYTFIEADNNDGSLFYLNIPNSASGSYSVASNGDCSVQYIDTLGDSYSIQGGSISINSPLFGGMNGSFQGAGINDINCQDKVSISGSFTVN